MSKSSTSSTFDSKLPTFGKNDNGESDDLLDAMIHQYAEFRRLMRSEVNNASYIDDESGAENDGASEEEMVDAKRQKMNSDGKEE